MPLEPSVWIWSPEINDYVEVVLEDYTYHPVDRRIRGPRGETLSWYHRTVRGVYSTKPSAPPPTAVGTKIEVQVEQRVTVAFTRIAKTSALERGHLSDKAWVDSDDVQDGVERTAPKVEATVVAVSGYAGATHYCSYCEEYSATNPAEDAPCAGGGASSWEKWSPPEIRVGEVITPKFE